MVRGSHLGSHQGPTVGGVGAVFPMRGREPVVPNKTKNINVSAYPGVGFSGQAPALTAQCLALQRRRNERFCCTVMKDAVRLVLPQACCSGTETGSFHTAALAAITDMTSRLQPSLDRLENLQVLTELQRGLVSVEDLVNPGRVSSHWRNFLGCSLSSCVYLCDAK